MGIEDTLYVLEQRKQLLAMDGASGEVKWTFNLSADDYTCPAVAPNGTLYLCVSSNLYALDGITGAKKWAAPSMGYGLLATGADGTIYAAGAKTLRAFDAATGMMKWMTETPGDAKSAPSIGSDGGIFVVTGDTIYTVSRVERETGVKTWTTSTPGPISAPIIGMDGKVFVTRPSAILALDGKRGVEEWRFSFLGNPETSPLLTSDGTIYVGINQDGSRVFALDAATGTLKWQTTMPYPCKDLTELAIGSDGTLYCGSDPKFFALHGSAPLADSSWPMFMHDPQHMGRATPWQPQLRIEPATLVDGQVRFQWSAAAVLQKAETITGPWQDLVVPGSSYSAVPEGPHRFYRLRER